jgi:hypothetical protein
MIGFIYIFTLFYWGVFYTDINFEHCHNLFKCLFIFIDTTWKEHPLWAETLKEWPHDHHHFGWGRFFIDALFMIFIIKIIGEMFTGIITERFGYLREKLEEIEED